jgi:hypothetical protein
MTEFRPIGLPVASMVATVAQQRRGGDVPALVAHLRGRGGVRTFGELQADLGLAADALRADLAALEAEGLIWRRDITHAPEGVEISEPCWWAPLVRMPDDLTRRIA